MCFKLHEILKYGRYVGNIFYYDSSFYIGVIRKQNGILGKNRGNPLKLLEKIRVGGKIFGTVGLPETHNFLFLALGQRRESGRK